MRRTAYTSSEVTAWTAPYRPSIAIVSLGWSVVGPLIPPEWVRVAVVEVPPHRHRVGFFAVDPQRGLDPSRERGTALRAARRALGYRVKLRRPEEVTAAAVLPPPESAPGQPPRRTSRSTGSPS